MERYDVDQGDIEKKCKNIGQIDRKIIYRILNKIIKEKVEYFASPFNVTGEFEKFCTEFPEDSIFGAIHDYFTTELTEAGGLNPPYLPEIEEKCVNRAKKQSKKHETMFSLTIPVFEGGERKNDTRALLMGMQQDGEAILKRIQSSAFVFHPTLWLLSTWILVAVVVVAVVVVLLLMMMMMIMMMMMMMMMMIMPMMMMLLLLLLLMMMIMMMMTTCHSEDVALPV